MFLAAFSPFSCGFPALFGLCFGRGCAVFARVLVPLMRAFRPLLRPWLCGFSRSFRQCFRPYFAQVSHAFRPLFRPWFSGFPALLAVFSAMFRAGFARFSAVVSAVVSRFSRSCGHCFGRGGAVFARSLRRCRALFGLFWARFGVFPCAFWGMSTDRRHGGGEAVDSASSVPFQWRSGSCCCCVSAPLARCPAVVSAVFPRCWHSLAGVSAMLPRQWYGVPAVFPPCLRDVRPVFRCVPCGVPAAAAAAAAAFQRRSRDVRPLFRLCFRTVCTVWPVSRPCFRANGMAFRPCFRAVCATFGRFSAVFPAAFQQLLRFSAARAMSGRRFGCVSALLAHCCC